MNKIILSKSITHSSYGKDGAALCFDKTYFISGGISRHKIECIIHDTYFTLRNNEEILKGGFYSINGFYMHKDVF